MHLVVLIPLAACVLCSAYCLTSVPANYTKTDRRVRRLGKMLFACPAIWAFCEVGIMISADETAALRFVPIASAAIVFIGPIAFDLGQTLANQARSTMTRSAGLVYGAGALLVISSWPTDWFIGGVREEPWGYAMYPGSHNPAYVAFIVGCGLFTYVRSRRAVADATELEARAGGRGITRWILALIVLGTATSVILPQVGVEVPPLTTAGFGLTALVLLWSMSRPQGYVFASQAIISHEILRSIHEGVVFVTLEDRVLLANEGMETFLGAPAEEIIGGSFQKHLDRVSLHEPCERIDVECQLLPISGPPISVAVSVSTARDDRGAPLGLVVVVRDLRQIELLRSQLVTSGRLAAVGQLAAGIAHEINNPLAFVRTNLGVLREHWAEVASAFDGDGCREGAVDALKEGDEIIGESIEGVDRAARIVRDVREFSHAGRPDREHVDVNDLLDRVLRISTTERAGGTKVVRAYGDVPLVPAAPQQLEQVFLNLVVNAMQATSGDGTITIQTEHTNDRVVVQIADDGSGIAPEVADRIFDPFFTTKAAGEGTGLGLSISHQIVQNHDGEISVEAGAERGACFRVSLPVEIASASASSTANSPGGR